jgi:hypothetical protein
LPARLLSLRPRQETSLHITLGLIGKTRADVMAEAVSAACLASPAFRANLPAGFAEPDFERAPRGTRVHFPGRTPMPAEAHFRFQHLAARSWS